MLIFISWKDQRTRWKKQRLNVGQPETTKKHKLVFFAFLFNSLLPVVSNQLRAEAGPLRRHGSLEEATVCGRASRANRVCRWGQRFYLMEQLVSDGALHRPRPLTWKQQPL